MVSPIKLANSVNDSVSNNNYIDLHFHILPAVDDGAKDVTMAMEMARLAVADGTSVIAATPHPDRVSRIGSREITGQAVANLNVIFSEQGITNLKIVPGVECYFVPEILTMLKSKELFPLNDSRYVLLEFNHVIAPVQPEQMLFRMRLAGYVPIIAHPERYKYSQNNINWLINLVHLGCLLQVTAGAFYGRFGPHCQKTAEALLRANVVHLIASDAHNVTSRPPGLTKARPAIEKIAGNTMFEQLAAIIPAKILANATFESAPPALQTAKPFWKFWHW
jgi:protein-tyrosine phosphatase